MVSGPKQACALSPPTGDSPEVHLAGDKTPNVLIKSLNPRARPPPCLGQRRGIRENREKRTGSCPSHPSSWPAHQHPLLCPQNTHQNATVTVLMLTQCKRTISKREQERGETAQQPSQTTDRKGWREANKAPNVLEEEEQETRTKPSRPKTVQQKREFNETRAQR